MTAIKTQKIVTKLWIQKHDWREEVIGQQRIDTVEQKLDKTKQ